MSEKTNTAETIPGGAAMTTMSDDLKAALPNETKIQICNAMHALQIHEADCPCCRLYTKLGYGDLCAKGEEIIAKEMAYADTGISFEVRR